LELLLVSAPEDANALANRQKERHRQLTKRNSFQRERGIPLPIAPPMVNRPDAKGQNWINFIHLGRKYYNLVLFAPSPLVHKKWIELISKQQQALRERSMIFEAVTLNDGFFLGPNKINCAAPYSKFLKL
jgi:RHO1 GDP-GTP exchange protein 1/2